MLTTSGNTAIGARIYDVKTSERRSYTENSINAMKNLLRIKKREVQGLHGKLVDMAGVQKKAALHQNLWVNFGSGSLPSA